MNSANILEQLSDSQLVANYTSTRDKKYFGEIYSRYLRPTYRFVYSKTGNTTVTEDLVSETFVTLLDIIIKYDHKAKLSTFIFGIAVNKIRQYWQKQKNKVDFEIDEETLFEIEEDTAAEVKTISEDKDKSDMKKLLARIPEKYRRVLEERFLKEKSINETAETLGLSSANVRVIQNRAIEKLKRLVGSKK